MNADELGKSRFLNLLFKPAGMMMESRLLPEMHRILKPEGRMAVWMFPVAGWVPKSILESGLFTFISKQNGVYNYRRH